MKKLHLTEISDSNNESELLGYLKEQWKLPQTNDLMVVGYTDHIREIKTASGNIFYSLKKIYHPVSNEELEYPISDLDSSLQIRNRGIHIHADRIEDNDALSSLIPTHLHIKMHVVLELSPLHERQRVDKFNPLALTGKTFCVLEAFPEDVIYRTPDGEISIDRSLLKYFEILNKKRIQQDYDQRREQLQRDYDRHMEQLQKNTQIEIDTLSQLKNQTFAEQTKLIELESTLVKQHRLHNELEDEIKAMSKTHEDLLAAIKSNVIRFQDLGLLSEDDIDNLFPENRTQEQDEHISFSEHLGNNTDQLIRHIQAHLYKTGILYPRHVLSDFFALLQTGDFIILAGDSGSGKTQLVKSFADAIGGRYSIIPVKPNWTGSEDLLGYYNPLEKRFLPSTFTEALLEARECPDVPYFICLDEMNLARVEYYFADFLSKLEERNPDKEPIIHLYPEDEADSNWVELNGALKLIDGMIEKHGAGKVSFIEMMQNVNLNRELRVLFGLSEKESLIGYYIHLRSIVRNSIMNTPSKYKFPANVRIIGAINIDETTNFLSPKILDRAHIIKFDNPLSYSYAGIKNEIAESGIDDNVARVPVKLMVTELGNRAEYPAFDEDDEFAAQVLPLIRNYLLPLGMEFGFRAIRQGLNYRNIMVHNGESSQIVLNNFILHKILPKLSFDGSRKVSGTEKLDILKGLEIAVQGMLRDLPPDAFHAPSYSAVMALKNMIAKAEANDKIVNYWA